MMLMLYTNTKEGKEVLEILEHVVSTDGMEVYKCSLCDELFGGRPSEVKEEKPICGICEMEIKAENYFPGEHEDYEED
ncbi:gp537 [Bacillus phage G]|uniref:Gp537 n=1 Tax=Bacillus phage G TaxID=2884420 RepID=G3MAS7_9CAUD|nr:gp537 [Bacillus phage G]AEO93794.1 gp537 [Bacillus phage G]